MDEMIQMSQSFFYSYKLTWIKAFFFFPMT